MTFSQWDIVKARSRAQSLVGRVSAPRQQQIARKVRELFRFG
jgi:hypothetical protein